MRRQLAIFSIAMPLSIYALAQEHQEHQEHASRMNHEHGVASLNLAIEGNQVSIDLDSPAVNLLGFEHAASQPEDIAKVAAVQAQLHHAEQLFQFPADAGCTLASADLDSPLFAEHEHEEPAHEDEHETAEHEHEHEEHNHPQADIEAQFIFNCAQPAALSSLQLPLFSVFPGLQRLNLQAITPNGQLGAELTPDHPVVSFN
tara:strand:+ start:5638 stop:6243 length:606 start_codon:yes stop_codon:yes gene_type:complete